MTEFIPTAEIFYSLMHYLLAWCAGVVLAVIFLSILWWTIGKALASKNAVFWFFSSMLLRLAVVTAGFYWVAGGQLDNLLASLLGFVMARFVIVHFVNISDHTVEKETQGFGHAP